MALPPGTRLGPYVITAQIGVGGMGEVYRATDTKLKRDVAIKVLPDVLGHDPDRLARFRREAQVLASLNHSHIAATYGIEDAGGECALVLELVEGETLADRIARGPMPLDEALPIAKQIAEALEAAHEQGIVHRDLKPANIKVRPDGTVKVLDFGLAKAMEPAGASTVNATMSPTISVHATQAGIILGTAAYMSPEQAAGKVADKRSDLWAFGVVMFEMLTGRRAFDGETVSHVLASVLKDEPNWAALPANTPVPLRRLLRRCLEKERRQRLDSAADARLEIDEALGTPSIDSSADRIGVDAQPSGWRRTLPWAVAVACVVALALVLALWAPWRTVPSLAPLWLSTELGADTSLVIDQGAAAVLSHDGKLLAFAAQKGSGVESQLFVRRLDQLQAMPLAGTDGARNPFFSPDDQSVAFFAGGRLKKIAVTGGAAITLADAPNGRGGTWAEDGTIVFTPDNLPQVRLLRVSSAGGTPQPVTTLAQGETTQRWPQMLPGGKALLYTGAPSTTGWDNANIVVQPLPAGERKILVKGGYYGRYLPSGHLVYLHEGRLFAAPFDLDRLEVIGRAIPVLQDVMTSALTGGAQFAFSDSGTAVYFPGENSDLNTVPIVWIDRDGKTAPLRSTPANWTSLLFSPDGSKLAMDISDGKQRDVWIYEWARDALLRLTFDPTDDVNPIWTPDGRRVAFGSKRGGNTFYNLYWQPADGSGDAQLLLESRDSHLIPGSWHPSGRYLAYHRIPQPNNGDLMILPLEGSDSAGWKAGAPTVFVKTPAGEQSPTFSPDGRWIAYFSDESGRNEVYVRPFPGPGGKWQVSTQGGTYPTWSRTRQELFYATLDQHIMVVPYRVEGSSFQAGKPIQWTETAFTTGGFRRFTLNPAGDRFAIGKQPEAQNNGQIVFIFNFFDELRRIAPPATE